MHNNQNIYLGQKSSNALETKKGQSKTRQSLEPNKQPQEQITIVVGMQV